MWTTRTSTSIRALGCALMLAPGWAGAESFLTNVVSGVYSNAGTVLVVGDTGPSNALEIVSGGWLESGQALVGNAADASHNLVRIRGAGSRWQTTLRFVLGREGSFNRVLLDQGARVDTGLTTIGGLASSLANELQISGTGTEWRSPSGFYLGDAGAGQRLRVESGARLVTGGFCSVGLTSQSHGNEVIITGPGSGWFHSLAFRLGDYGSDSNTLTIAAGGLLDCVEGIIGNGTGNQANVTGAGSLWVCRSTLFLGGEGMGNRLHIQNGGRVNAVSAFVTGDTNEVVVEGGSVWQTGSAGTQLVFGYRGSGNRLVLTNAALVTAQDAYVLGNDNLVHLAGAQDVLDVRGTLVLGDEFALRNRITLGDGAVLRAGELRLAGDRAVVRATGPAARIWASNEVWVGHAFGAGNQVQLEAGAQLVSGPVFLGGDDSLFNPHDRGQTNAIVLDGAGTSWNVGGDLRVGSVGGRSILQLSGAAVLENDTGYVGYYSASRDNEVVLSGAATFWNNRGGLYVGYEGWGNRLVASNGVTLLSTVSAVGWRDARDNVAEVSGAGTRWINQGELTVGGSGFNNSLMLGDGAFLETGATHVGAHPGTTTDGKTNRMWISGVGTVLTNRGTLHVGALNGFNTLVVSNQARVDAAAWVLGNDGAFFNNACRVVDGGQVRLHGAPPSGPAPWTVTRASVTLEDADIAVGSLVVSGTPSHPFVFNQGDLRVSGGISVSNGTPFRVGNGLDVARLEVGAGPHLFADGLEIGALASARLEGFITGHVTNQGALEVGETVAALQVTGMMHLGSSSELAMELAGGSPGAEADWIQVQGPVVLGGMLRVRLLSGYIPFSVAVLPLIEHQGATGSFINVTNGGRVFVEGTSNSFRLDVTGTLVALTDFQGPDALPDSDGIDDAWALAYFGHSPLTQEERESDTDLDGATAYQEYVAGTHPFDQASVFRLVLQEVAEAGMVVLRFPAATNRLYRIGRSLELPAWTYMSNPDLTPVAGGFYEWVDVEAGSGPAFYHVEVRLP